MARNQGRSANVVYGICVNTNGKEDGTPCSKCQNKEIQTIRASKEFVCEECHEPLRKVEGKKGPNTKLIIIIAAAVLVVGGAVAAVLLLTGGKKTPEPFIPVEDTTVVLPETKATTDEPAADTTVVLPTVDTTVAEPVAEEEVAEPTPEPVAQPTPTPTPSPKPATTSNGYNLGWGNYSGPMQGGKPHGAGGSISVKSSYSINLNDAAGTKLQVHPGDKIENTKFVGGKLRSGELQRADGSRKWFNC